MGEAWTYAPNGAGRYRNLETGLERKFNRKPFRGKWQLLQRRRVYLHVENGVIYWAKRAARRQSSEDGG